MLENKAIFRLAWHGADTLVQLDKKDAEKTEVKTGDVVEVSMKMAESLLKSNAMWTMEGDEPMEQGYMKARAAAIQAQDARRTAKNTKKVGVVAREDEVGDVTDLTEDGIAAMKGDELKENLTAMGVEFKAKTSVADLKEMLLDAVQGATEDAETAPEGEDDSEVEDEVGDDENDEDEANDEE